MKYYLWRLLIAGGILFIAFYMIANLALQYQRNDLQKIDHQLILHDKRRISRLVEQWNNWQYDMRQCLILIDNHIANQDSIVIFAEKYIAERTEKQRRKARKEWQKKKRTK